jgi:hypothetical protein
MHWQGNIAALGLSVQVSTWSIVAVLSAQEMQQPHQPDPYASPRDKQRSALGGASTSGLSFSSTTGGAGEVPLQGAAM